jgi:hypothetical protein
MARANKLGLAAVAPPFDGSAMEADLQSRNQVEALRARLRPLAAFAGARPDKVALELRRLFPGITDKCAGAGVRPDHRRLEAAAQGAAASQAQGPGALNPAPPRHRPRATRRVAP